MMAKPTANASGGPGTIYTEDPKLAYVQMFRGPDNKTSNPKKENPKRKLVTIPP
jgi:hypothetical protein